MSYRSNFPLPHFFLFGLPTDEREETNTRHSIPTPLSIPLKSQNLRHHDTAERGKSILQDPWRLGVQSRFRDPTRVIRRNDEIWSCDVTFLAGRKMNERGRSL